MKFWDRMRRGTPYNCFASTTIAIVLDTIPATALATDAQFVVRVVSLSGTKTSDPGPGLGSLEPNIERRRLRISPFAYRTLTRPLSAL